MTIPTVLRLTLAFSDQRELPQGDIRRLVLIKVGDAPYHVRIREGPDRVRWHLHYAIAAVRRKIDAEP